MSFWESSPPVGPPENPTRQLEKQAAQGRRRRVYRPRARLCLLKGCERRFHPVHARQRYCSRECRAAARAWSEWKARQAYRATAAGKQKRNQQSRRYRKRIREREPREKEAAAEAARVIARKIFFRRLLPPAGLLRALLALTAIAAATVLLAGLPACPGAGLGTGTALANKTSPVSSSHPAAACAAAVKAKKISLPY